MWGLHLCEVYLKKGSPYKKGKNAAQIFGKMLIEVLRKGKPTYNPQYQKF